MVPYHRLPSGASNGAPLQRFPHKVYKERSDAPDCPMSQTPPPSDQFQRVAQIMATLRAPGGCPWDRKQTHASLKPYLLEETYEVLETIDHEDRAKLKEELGDVLLQVIFHSQIATEAGQFTID